MGYPMGIICMVLVLGVCVSGKAVAGPVFGTQFTDESYTVEHNGSETDNNVWAVYNKGTTGSVLTFSLSESCSWLSLSPSSGSITRPSGPWGEKEIDININAAGLSSGSYSCTVALTSNDPTYPGPYYADVDITVQAPPPPEANFGTNHKNDERDVPNGGSHAESNYWRVTNSGDAGSSCDYTYTKSYNPTGTNWLTISPSSGTLAQPSGTTVQHDVDLIYNAAGLVAGDYVCTVQLESNAPNVVGQTFPATVTMHVDAPPGPDWDILNVDLSDFGPFEPGTPITCDVRIKNVGTLVAPASRLKIRSYDYDTGNDERIFFADVQSLSVEQEVVVPITTFVGSHTTKLAITNTVNADALSERSSANNTNTWYILSIGDRNTSNERLFGDVSEKTGTSNDPVNTASGNFTHEETDFSAVGVAGDVVFARYYNSLSTDVGTLGLAWRHSFQYTMDLSASFQPGIVYPDGRSEYWSEDSGNYNPLFPGVLTKLENLGGSWRATQKDLTILNFDSVGKITSMVDKNGNTTAFAYSGSDLLSVTDPAGRVLSFTYASGKLSQVVDWSGRTLSFGYSGQYLLSVNDIMGEAIQYGYDGNGYLSRITDQRGIVVLQNTVSVR